MERLRTYAIKHRRGFTLDVEIDPVTDGRRWMRLIGAPVCEGGRAVLLHGLKLIIRDEKGGAPMAPRLLTHPRW